MQVKKSRSSAFTLIEIMIVVSVVLLLALMAIPNWVRARTNSQTNSCINNLRQIDGAKQEWALDNRIGATNTPGISDIQPYLGRGDVGTAPACPTDSQQTFPTSYSMGNLSTKPTCLIDPTNHVLPN